VPSLIPFVVQLPLAVTVAAIRTPVESATRIISISGSLQALLSGTFQVDVKDDLGNLIGSLVWTAAGLQSIRIDDGTSVLAGGYLSFDVASIGVGALGCYVTIWGQAN